MMSPFFLLFFNFLVPCSFLSKSNEAFFFSSLFLCSIPLPSIRCQLRFSFIYIYIYIFLIFLFFFIFWYSVYLWHLPYCILHYSVSNEYDDNDDEKCRNLLDNWNAWCDQPAWQYWHLLCMSSLVVLGY